ncbi:methyltransferase domain-containing protein, partial [Klebsiella pneumoniae]|nr:methyltransferase domain-containing protein [Klebsiella pneumoniae]
MTTRPENYYAEKYGLTPTHSEVLAALPHLEVGKALDLGCGQGRNSLFLNQHGFDVTAWDSNPASLERLNSIIAEENLQNIHTEL